MGEEKPAEKTVCLSKRRRNIIVGAIVAACLVAAGAGLFRTFVASSVVDDGSAADRADTGLINWQQVIEAHPDYEKWKALREECRVLELESKDLAELFTVKPPELDKKAFDDSVWAKNAQDVIGKRAEIERKSKRLTEEYRKATDAEYQARRNAINEEYLNALLNINIKLDNQAAMHNALDSQQQKDAERAEWEEQRLQLRRERGVRQVELYQEYQQQISDHVKQELAPELEAWRKDLPQKQASQKADAAAKKTEAEKRNAEAMQKQMEKAKMVQQRLEKRKELAEKRSKLQALETHILNDVAGKAAKIAILHHFTLILADRPQLLANFGPHQEMFERVTRSTGMIVGINTIDVTDELVQEIKALPSNTEEGTEDNKS